MRQETDGVLLESFLIYEPEHQATWFKAECSTIMALIGWAQDLAEASSRLP